MTNYFMAYLMATYTPYILVLKFAGETSYKNTEKNIEIRLMFRT